ncbi:MAG: hypothetical protein A2W93_05585 [Bacteroidetes bacterium GWF2_43_63]|nr:MAG: hypothetical protein A2W94_07475 [Bacteroidetes bacterium GWE2_42_42]OFY55487.1 MAG: hypothetical protein A2W93_05585 [Bacteroidetes bacterium GWF2_43_63]HBG69964.1 hypothetical protein [Bacteroidales bacterium]HCB62609.1 hypothetical protein [Bacteroidales bacterium]HCY23729.1 hypothetical protein [Bacteroidales bacterium]
MRNETGNIVFYVYDEFHYSVYTSSSFITNATGYATEHLQYLPYGELFVDQTPPHNDFETRYKFSGKELDPETNYSYFGARYYDSDLSVWLSVDPLSDKYPNTSPFMYCLGNPVVLIDPNGMDTAFADNQVRTDFQTAQSSVNKTISDISTKLKDPEISKRKTAQLEEQLSEWNKIKDDFDYICSKSTPMNTYSSDMTGFRSEVVGHTETKYNEETNEITSNKVYIRAGRVSTVIHENRHTRQSPLLPLCDREIEAFTYQSIFSPSDVKKSIDNARSVKYPPGGAIDPALMPKWGIIEMVKDVYKCE